MPRIDLGTLLSYELRKEKNQDMESQFVSLTYVDIIRHTKLPEACT